MKNAIKRLVAMLMVVALVLSLCPMQIISVFAEGDLTEVVYVTVVDEDNNPIVGATVTIGTESTTTDNEGKASASFVIAEGAEEQTIPVTAVKEGYETQTGSAPLSYGTESTSVTLTLPKEKPTTADLTVNVYYAGGLLSETVTVTVTLFDSNNVEVATADTVNGVATFSAVSLADTYSVSVEKPSEIVGTYYVAPKVEVTKTETSFNSANLVAQRIGPNTDLYISIASGSDVNVLKSEDGKPVLCYDWSSAVFASPVWNDTKNVSIEITDNPNGVACISDSNGTETSNGKFITVTKTTGNEPIRFTAKETKNGNVYAQQNYQLNVAKADAVVTYKVYGQEITADQIINFSELGSKMQVVANGSFETQGDFVIHASHEALEISEDTIFNKKATLNSDNSVMAVPVTVIREADDWYNAASISFKVQSLRADRPEEGFGAVTVKNISVNLSEQGINEFSVAPKITTTGAPDDRIVDSEAAISYILKDQKLYNVKNNTAVEENNQLVTIDEKGMAKVNPDFYGEATLVITVQDSDCFLGKIAECKVEVKKDSINADDKPFTLTLTNGDELPYSFDGTIFTIGEEWITSEITLKSAESYTVSVDDVDAAEGVALAQGEKTHTIVVKPDNAHAAELSTALFTKSDATAPENVFYTITSTVVNTILEVTTTAVFDGDVMIEIFATDNESGIAKVSVKINEDDYKDASKEGDKYVYTIKATSISEASIITVNATNNAALSTDTTAHEPAKDAQGNTVDYSHIFADGQPAEVIINVGAPNTKTTAGEQIYTENATDWMFTASLTEQNYDTSEKAKYSLYCITTGETVLENVELTAGENELFDLSKLDDGEYTLTITCPADVAKHPATVEFEYGSYDKETETYTYTFIKDTTAPEITVNVGTPYNEAHAVYSDIDESSKTDFTVDIQETNYGKEELAKWSLEGATAMGGDIANVGNTTLFNVNDLTDGTYTLKISYTDDAGHPVGFSDNRETNAEGEYTYTFIKDTKAPEIKVSYTQEPFVEVNGTPVYSDVDNKLPTITITMEEANYALTDKLSVTCRDTKELALADGNSNVEFNIADDYNDGEYELTFNYTDAAGHQAIISADRGDAENGAYSYEFIKDTTAPEITVNYTTSPVGAFNETPVYNENSLPVISVTMEEANYALTDKLSVTCKGRKDLELADGNSEVEFNIADDYNDGEYELTFNYTDAAGHKAIISADRGDAENGAYSYEFIKDTAAPNELSYTIVSKAYRVLKDVLSFGITAYFNGEVALNIDAKDETSGINNVTVQLSGQSEAKEATLKNNFYEYTIDSSIIIEANAISVVATDNACHSTSVNEGTTVVDESAQTVNAVVSDTVNPQIAISVGMPDSKTTVGEQIYTEKASDWMFTALLTEQNYDVSEKAKYSLYCITTEKTVLENVKLTAGEKNDLFDLSKLNDGEYTLSITYKEDIVKLPAEYTDNGSELTYGSAKDGEYTYTFIKDTTAPEITVSYSTSPVGTFNETPVYNENSLPVISVTMEETNYALTDKLSVTCRDTKELALADGNSNVEFNIADDYNDGVYELTFSYTDIAGHQANITTDRGVAENGSYSYKFIRDTIVPVCGGITLVGRQDTINGMEFYKASTSGTATVTEQFFNAKLFALTANDNGINVDWTQYPMNPATGTFALSGDGHYTLVLTGSDDAKHQMQTYTYPATVVLDSTNPVISMTTSPAVNVVERNQYFAEIPTCTVHIIERNFYNSGAVQITCTRNGESYPINGLSWAGGGDAHTAAFDLAEDGEYRVSISYSDPSKNAATYTYDYAIIVDKTAPEVSITDAANKPLEDKTAYNASNISFEINLTDENLDAKDILVELTGWVANEDEDGNLKLVEEDFSSFISDVVVSENGKTFNVDVRNLKDDAVYTLHVSGKDLAGNSFDELRYFSVNRDGSTYYIEGETAELVEKYYTNTPHTIEIHEVCAEVLKTTDINITHNLDVVKYELEDETDADRHFKVEMPEGCKWSEYLYQVLDTNFEEQGAYAVATSSVAEMTEVKKSSSEVVAVSFLMDTTEPTVNVAGIEDGGRYQTDSREITISCQDDQMLDSVEIWLDDTLLEEYHFEDEMVSAKDFTVRIPGANEYRMQQLRVVIQDKAGNEPTETLIGVFVSTNLWYLYRNYILIGAAVLALGIAATLIILKKRKHS